LTGFFLNKNIKKLKICNNELDIDELDGWSAVFKNQLLNYYSKGKWKVLKNSMLSQIKKDIEKENKF
jgi:hypothetical protein